VFHACTAFNHIPRNTTLGLGWLRWELQKRHAVKLVGNILLRCLVDTPRHAYDLHQSDCIDHCRSYAKAVARRTHAHLTCGIRLATWFLSKVHLRAIERPVCCNHHVSLFAGCRRWRLGAQCTASDRPASPDLICPFMDLQEATATTRPRVPFAVQSAPSKLTGP
jgi:hypothetical protein